MPPAASFLKKAWQKLSKIKSINALSAKMMQKTQTGKFGAMMDVELINDGPVTFMIEN